MKGILIIEIDLGISVEEFIKGILINLKVKFT